MRVLLKIVAVIIIIVVFAAVCCIRPVNKTPYQKADYYKRTINRLEKVTDSLPEAERRPLFAGWGKAEITPPIGVPLAGFGARKGNPSTGVHDRLYVRVITLKVGSQQIFLVGYDALLLNPPIARILEDSLKARFNLEPQQFLYTATHTHSGPGGWGNTWFERQFAGPPDPIVERILIDSTLAACERARNVLAPASYAVGSVDAPQYLRNRLVGEKGKIDPELVFLALTCDDRIRVVFTTYSAHATVLSHRNMQFSGDYPGYLERKLESEIDGLALFAAAGLGSHSPRGKGKSFERAQYIGVALADSLLSHFSAFEFNDTVELRYLRLQTDMSSMQLRISNNLRLAPWIAKRIIPVNDSYFQTIAINDFLIIGSPGEFSGELALQVKEYARRKKLHVTVTSFNGCYLGYVTPEQYYHLNKYETRLMSFFGPFTGSYFVDIMTHIVDSLARSVESQ